MRVGFVERVAKLAETRPSADDLAANSRLEVRGGASRDRLVEDGARGFERVAKLAETTADR